MSGTLFLNWKQHTIHDPWGPEKYNYTMMKHVKNSVIIFPLWYILCVCVVLTMCTVYIIFSSSTKIIVHMLCTCCLRFKIMFGSCARRWNYLTRNSDIRIQRRGIQIVIFHKCPIVQALVQIRRVRGWFIPWKRAFTR